jgi:hypothetical protein
MVIDVGVGVTDGIVVCVVVDVDVGVDGGAEVVVWDGVVVTIVEVVSVVVPGVVAQEVNSTAKRTIMVQKRLICFMLYFKMLLKKINPPPGLQARGNSDSIKSPTTPRGDVGGKEAGVLAYDSPRKNHIQRRGRAGFSPACYPVGP